MNKRKIFAAVTAAALLLSGCGNPQSSDSGETSVTEKQKREFSPAAEEIADEFFKGNRHSFPSWADKDDDTVIGSVDLPEHIPDYDITFGEFMDEYIYYLMSMGIEDDMSDENKDSCRSYRASIVNYLAFEKMYMYAAKLDYGITPETLTTEQTRTARETADREKDDWASSFYASAQEKLGEGAGQEEIDAICHEVLDVLFDKCGIDEDIFYQWEIREMIYQLAMDEMLKDDPVTDDDVKAQMELLIQEAKETAANDPSTYESAPAYSLAYVPEGTRKARHILLRFSDETQEAINEAVENNDMEKADEAAQKDLQERLSAIADDIMERLNNGEDFDKLLEEYPGSGEHIVLTNSVEYEGTYIDRVYSMDKVNDIAPLFYDRSGVYIIQYTGEAEITDDDRKLLEDQLRSYLESQAQQEVQKRSYELWTKDVNYNMNCELLQIDEADLIQNTGTSDDIEITE